MSNDNNDINCVIKDGALTLNVSVDINKFTEYFEYFKGYNNFTNNSIIPSKELLQMMIIVKYGENDLIDIFKFFDYYLINKEFIIKFIEYLNINKILESYNYIYDCLYLKDILNEVVFKYLKGLSLNVQLNKVIEYDLYFHIPYINKKLLNYDVNNKVAKNYVNKFIEIISHRKLNDNHIILKICLYNKNYIIYNIYNKLKLKFKKIKYIHDKYLNILLKNKTFAIIYIFDNMDDKYKFEYIYEIYKNNSGIIFNNLNIYYNDFNYYLSIFIKINFFKIEILKRYLNGIYFNINPLDVVDYLIRDKRLSEEFIKKIILMETPYNLLLNLFNIFNINYNNDNSIKYQNIKNFVNVEYRIKYEYTIKNNEYLEYYFNNKNGYNCYSFINKYHNLYSYLNYILNESDRYDYICIVLSKKIIYRSLNVTSFLNYYLNINNIIDFINKITINIEKNFIKDINESNLNYILTTEKVDKNLNRFDNIIFKIDNNKNEFGFILDEDVIKFIVFKLQFFNFHYSNLSKLLFDLSVYSIRYNYYDALEEILNYVINIIKYLSFHNENNKKYTLINYAYSRKIINILNYKIKSY